MLINLNTKDSYNLSEIVAAKKNLEANPIDSIDKLSPENQKDLLTILIGEHDNFGLHELKKNIDLTILNYLKFPSFYVNLEQKQKNITDQNKILDHLIEINKTIKTSLKKPEILSIYRPYCKQSTALHAFYPLLRMENIIGKDFSAVLNGEMFKRIAVPPPQDSFTYLYVNNILDNSKFILHCLNSSSRGIWRNYIIEKAAPTATTWGLFLLSIGIHPIYTLEHRKPNDGYTESPLFDCLFPNWGIQVDQKIQDLYQENDLKPYKIKGAMKLSTLSDLIPNLKKNIVTWYNQGNFLPNFPQISDLIQKLEDIFNNINDPVKKAEMKKIIFALNDKKFFSRDTFYQHLATISYDARFNLDIYQEIEKLSKVASFLFINSNPHIGICRWLRTITSIPERSIQSVLEATSINKNTWLRAEQGSVVLSNTYWSLLLLSLDLHPIYRIKPRVNPIEIQIADKIYKTLHFTAKSQIDKSL